jgi:hypothetical protein
MTTINENTVDIDLDSFSKEELISLISFAHKENITFNEAIVKMLENLLKSRVRD